MQLPNFPSSQKGFAPIFILLIILLGITVGIFLIKNPTFFQPKADTSSSNSLKINDAAFEPIYNPFGDAWALKKTSNPSIPVSFSAGCYREGEKGTTDEIPDREIEYLAKTNAPIIYIDCAVVQDENYKQAKYEKLQTFIKKTKAVNPAVKVIGYIVLHEGMPVSPLVVKGADSGDSTMESFLIHKKGLPATKDNRLNGRPDHPEWGYAPLFDLTNANYRNYAVPKVAAAIKNMGLDGVLIDAISWNTLAGLGVSDSVPDEIINAWPAGQAQFIEDLKTAVGSEKLLFANVKLEQSDYIANDLLRTGRLDGIMLEDPIGPEANDFVPGSYRYDDLKRLFEVAASRDKYVWTVVNTNVNCADPGPNCFNTTNEAAQRHYANYFLAAFLQLMTNPKQMMIHYTPIQNRAQFLSETYFRIWDLNIGTPAAPAEQIGNGIYLRKFQNAHVVLNTTYNSFQLPVAEGSGLVSPTGVNISGAIIPAKEGVIFATQKTIDDWQGIGVQSTPSSVDKACSARPEIIKKTQMTADGMQVALAAGTNAVLISNSLSQIIFTNLTNATVVLQNSTQVTGAQTIGVENNAINFTIKQVTKGQPTTVTLKAVDSCGEYDLFFGGGTDAEWPNYY